MTHRAPGSALFLLLGLTTLPAASQGASRHLEANAVGLAIESPCVRSAAIQPDPSLNGRVTVDATADHDEELAQLVLTDGSPARLRRAGHKCWEPARDSDFEPTLALTIRVPPAMAIAIEESGGADYSIGALQGRLSLDISGGVKLHADHSAALAVDLSGGANIGIGRVEGSVKAELSGGGIITIDQATLADLTLSVSGGGAFTLRNGTAARASVELSGAGAVVIGGTTGDATVDMSGVGSVRFGKVTGRLTKDISGIGAVTVDSP